MKTALVIGAGPAGLMAAEELVRAGLHVVVAEAKPTVARKFLMAGKSGLNLTKDEPDDDFLSQFGDAIKALRPALQEFGPQEVKSWAADLGQEVFTGSSGRVFPKAMKASPLLRAWLGRLQGAGVEFRTRWRWVRWDGMAFGFETPDGAQDITPDVCVLALGGASWARLGSDGAWAEMFATRGIPLAPFQPANMGFVVNWAAPMARHFGSPVKGCRLTAGGTKVLAEFVVSQRGIEGGGIYAVSRAMREDAQLRLDLMPDWSAEKITAKLAKARAKDSLSNTLRKGLGLDAVKIALLQEFARPLPKGADLAALIKDLPISHAGPRPLDEAISTAGGVPFSALTEDFALKAVPNVFCVGEMLDWEAPTGGYLITGCLATGRWAGRAAGLAART